jgi:phosphoribosylaminoimidazole-succinocarboxamide synthase
LRDKAETLYEGKAKKVYATDSPDLVIIEYKDDATAFNGEKKGTIDSKGVINNEISSVIFKMLNAAGVKTHFVEKLNEREQLCKKVEIIPLEVIVRNTAAGSFTKRYAVPEGTVLRSPVAELCYKDDALGDPFINDSIALALGFAEQAELETIYKITGKVNKLLLEFFNKIGIKLIDFKLEFGRAGKEILLADEISPDTCRFWDKKTDEKLDKDRFRRDMGGIKEAYEEILSRLK